MVKDQNKEVKDLKERLARALADYDNLKKRVEKESEEFYLMLSARTGESLLPVLDMIESAQKHLADSGLEIAIGEFRKILGQLGLSEVKPPKGEKFDENLHEAIDGSPGDDIIEEVVLSGWKAKDKLVRPAKVKTGKGKN